MRFDENRQNFLRIFAGIIICLFLILADGMGWLDGVYSFGNYIVSPVRFWVGRATQGVEDVALTIFNIGDLRSENSELVIENAKLEAELQSCEEVKKENEALKKQTNIEGQGDFELEMARILGIDRQGEAQHIIVDKGVQDNVSKGDAVILGKILVGEVRDVFDHTARVRLISNQNSNIAVISQETRAKGLLHGTLEGLIMEEILENAEIEKGNTVLVWSDEFPKGLVVGNVSEVKVMPTSSTKKAIVKPSINFEDLKYIFILTDF
jgi:rod shape-determining protein MreC